MVKLLWIAAGGCLGAVFRYAVAGWVQRLANGSFPAGTLAVNVVGCFVIGVLGSALAGPYLVREEVRIGLLVGVLGAFTTFSTFGWETLALVGDGQIARAALYVILSNACSLAAVWIGLRIAERFLGV